MINKMRVLIYKTHLSTIKIHIENTINYWSGECKVTGECAIVESYIVDLENALEECNRQLEQLSDFEITATSHRKAHEEFNYQIIRDSQNIRGLPSDRFPKYFVVGSLSMPYILESMFKYNQEVRKLNRDDIEVDNIKKHLKNYLELVKSIVN